MSEAVELYKKDGTTAGIFYCSECRVVYGSKDSAQYCHSERLCACGNKIDRKFYCQCSECDRVERNAKEDAREAERFEKAKKVQASEYTGGMVFGRDDQYYESVEDAIDQYLEGQEPEYVWACKDVGVAEASAESLYENILENMWEDADVSDLYGVDELEVAIIAFNKANEGISVWEPDYSIAILTDEVV
jgi:hypothetical protein